MDPRYARNIPALSETECESLWQKRILVVGCGGLGGHIIDQLARIGVGFLRVVDGDVFEESNLNRQLLSRIPLLGVSKARAAADHVSRINPDMTVEAVEVFMTRQKVHALIEGCDIVLDALDNIPTKFGFMLCQANAAWNTIPDEKSFEYGGYEADASYFEKGEAERMVKNLNDMLLMTTDD